MQRNHALTLSFLCLRRAARSAWERKDLWPLGIVAGVLWSGVILNDLVPRAKMIAQVAHEGITVISPQLETILARFEGPHLAAILSGGVASVVLIGLIILAFAAACQHALLNAAHHHATARRPSWGMLIRHGVPRTLPMLLVNLGSLVLISNIILGGTQLIIPLTPVHSIADAVFGAIFAGALLALALVVQILSLLTLLFIAREGASIRVAFAESWQTWNRHKADWLLLALTLFCANAVITLGYHGILLLMSAPFRFFVSAAIASGSFSMLSTVFLMQYVTVTILSLAVAGWSAVFTYATWSECAVALDGRRPVTHHRRSRR